MGHGFTRQSFSMPPLMLEDLKEEALRRDMTLSQLIRSWCGTAPPIPTVALTYAGREASDDHSH